MNFHRNSHSLPRFKDIRCIWISWSFEMILYASICYFQSWDYRKKFGISVSVSVHKNTDIEFSVSVFLSTDTDTESMLSVLFSVFLHKPPRQRIRAVLVYVSFLKSKLSLQFVLYCYKLLLSVTERNSYQFNNWYIDFICIHHTKITDSFHVYVLEWNYVG